MATHCASGSKPNATVELRVPTRSQLHCGASRMIGASVTTKLAATSAAGRVTAESKVETGEVRAANGKHDAIHVERVELSGGGRGQHRTQQVEGCAEAEAGGGRRKKDDDSGGVQVVL
eukprot:631028-Prymnesium_polylepis.1